MGPPHNNQTAFCHVFQHLNRNYVYDVNSNELLEVDNVLAAVLPVLEADNDQHVIDILRLKFAVNDIKRAIREIRVSRRDEKLFLARHPKLQLNAQQICQQRQSKSQPQHLTLSITEQCNLRCRYCLYSSDNTWTRIHNEQQMPQETAFAAVDLFLKHFGGSFPSISFYGGEPLLQFQLIKSVVQRVRQNDDNSRIRFIIDTNGSLLTDEIISFVLKEKIYLQISLDGPAFIHDRYRITKNGKPTHKTLMDNLHQLLARDPTAATRLSFIATLSPPYDLLAVARYFRDFPLYRDAGISTSVAVTVNRVDLEGIDIEENSDPRLSEQNFAAARKFALKRYISSRVGEPIGPEDPALEHIFDDGLIRFYNRSRYPLPDTITPTGACFPGGKRLFVSANGNLLPCERVGETMTIGHVSSGLDYEAIQQLYIRYFSSLGNRCSNCWALRMCQICFTTVSATHDSSKIVTISHRICKSTQASIEATLKLYLTIREQNPRALDFLKETSLLA